MAIDIKIVGFNPLQSLQLAVIEAERRNKDEVSNHQSHFCEISRVDRKEGIEDIIIINISLGSLK